MQYLVAVAIGGIKRGRYTIKTIITKDGQVRTVPEWADMLGLNKNTIYKRLTRFQLPSAAILSPEIVYADKAGRPPKETNTNFNHRVHCIKNNQTCEHYSECTDSMLGLLGAKPWVEPTSDCYVEARRKRI